MSIPWGVTVPFVQHLGVTLELFDGGESELHYRPLPEHNNSFGVAHGGAVMTLLDVSMAVASRSVQKDMGVITIEMKTSFMRPSTGKLVSRGRLIHRTATMAFAEATITDEKGQVCAHSTGTFKYVRRLPTGPGSANDLNSISTD